MDDDFLQILSCPDTQQSLDVADETLIASLNELISAGTLINRAGERVTEPLEGGLIQRETKAYLYPIIDGIPILLIGDSIALSQLDAT